MPAHLWVKQRIEENRRVVSTAASQPKPRCTVELHSHLRQLAPADPLLTDSQEVAPIFLLPFRQNVTQHPLARCSEPSVPCGTEAASVMTTLSVMRQPIPSGEAGELPNPAIPRGARLLVSTMLPSTVPFGDNFVHVFRTGGVSARSQSSRIGSKSGRRWVSNRRAAAVGAASVEIQQQFVGRDKHHILVALPTRFMASAANQVTVTTWAMNQHIVFLAQIAPARERQRICCRRISSGLKLKSNSSSVLVSIDDRRTRSAIASPTSFQFVFQKTRQERSPYIDCRPPLARLSVSTPPDSHGRRLQHLMRR